MSNPKPSLFFAGLGAMGYGMASHLLHSRFPVIAYDVYQPLMLKLVSEGGASANTPMEAAKHIDFMIVMVANHLQATPLLFHPVTGAVGGLKEGATIIVCSTVAPAYIMELENRLIDAGRSDINLIDAPVSGGVVSAANGTLSIFSSGDDKALFAPHVQSILTCLSNTKKLYHVPGGLGSGSKAKLIHQIFAGVQIAMASEAMGLAAIAGFDTKLAFDELCAGEGSSWMFANRAQYMLEPAPERYSATSIIAKDLGIVSGTAREERFPLPLVGAAEQLFLSAIGAGWGALDDCVVVRLYLPPARPGLVAERAGRASMGGDGVGVGAGVNGGVGVGDIKDLMVGVHLAAMSEAMAFCERLGIETGLMYDIVSNAAGWSRGFEEYFPSMKEGGWRLKRLEGIKGIRNRLVSVIFAFAFAFVLME